MLKKDVSKKSLVDAIKNIIFYGIATLVITFIGNALGFRTAALFLAGIFSLVVVIGLFPFLVSLTLTPIGIILTIAEYKKRNNEDISKQMHLLAGTFILLIENGFSVLYVWYLYKAFFN